MLHEKRLNVKLVERCFNCVYASDGEINKPFIAPMLSWTAEGLNVFEFRRAALRAVVESVQKPSFTKLMRSPMTKLATMRTR